MLVSYFVLSLCLKMSSGKVEILELNAEIKNPYKLRPFSLLSSCLS